ncbi:hypothetical protein, partial [Pandoraea sp. PE-S2T-3]|uniref:hypothetical protein n=1 Tax=Pandoraea sp. PE-S2T-3 TaxID=1986993 RepID=UPI001124E8C9
MTEQLFSAAARALLTRPADLLAEIEHLIEAGADVNACELYEGRPLLYMLIDDGRAHPDVVRLLASFGASLDTPCQQGTTHQQAGYGTARELLEVLEAGNQGSGRTVSPLTPYGARAVRQAYENGAAERR